MIKYNRIVWFNLAGLAVLVSLCSAGCVSSTPTATAEGDPFDQYRSIHHDYKDHILSAVVANNKDKLDALTKQFAAAHQQFVSVSVSWQDSSGQSYGYRYDPGARSRAMARGPSPGAIQINWGGSDKLHVLESPGGYVLIDTNRKGASSAGQDELVRLVKKGELKAAQARIRKRMAFENGVLRIRLILKKEES
jgi:hypothetical protein